MLQVPESEGCCPSKLSRYRSELPPWKSQALRSGIADSVAFATHSVSKLEASGAKEGCTSDKFDSERMARLAVDEPANSKSTTKCKKYEEL